MVSFADLDWRKSSFSPSNNCVEMAHVSSPEQQDEPLVLVRDSKNTNGPVLAFSRAAYGSFLRTVPEI